MPVEEVVLPWTLRAAVGPVAVEAPGGVALTVLVLLSSSLHAFPSPTLPKG